MRLTSCVPIAVGLQMVATKNAQLKDFRVRLAKYETDDCEVVED
jgi:hypothetical protein